MTDSAHNQSDLLTILQEASGKHVSGEYLSKCLGITRSAVWKRIATLKKEGYLIEASTRKGYRLATELNAYGKHSIQNGLITHTIGRELKYFENIGSTNTVLKQYAYDGAVEGTVVVADSQSKGRGRLGRSWMSAPEKGIWMSILLKPPLHPNEVQALTLAASVAVCRALENSGIQGMGIKWPNDILLEGKKVCGILTELSAEAERVGWVILGIGLNVSHKQEDFPAELAMTATSLKLCSNSKVLNRSIIAAEILNCLEEVYYKYLQYGSTWMVEEWKHWNLTLGRKVRLISRNEELTVLAADILPDGRLVVKKDDGTTMEVLSGEISLRNE